VIPALSRGTVDRAGGCRKDDAWLDAAWADPTSLVLVLDGGVARVMRTEAGPRLALVAPADAPEGERYLLGVEDGRAYWAVPGAPPDLPGTRSAGLREVGAELDDRDAGLLVHAVALANWHATHPRCPRCGDPTRVVSAGASRYCDTDGSEHFPRTDPAMIVLVHDGGDRCVLGRQERWPPRRFSILAGFVEPGESAEQAVAREVAEEVGLAVTDLAYISSQPWPFPSSLMLGYTARAVEARELVLEDQELAEARWFTRAEVVDAIAGRHPELLLPPSASIAWRIITDWAGQPCAHE
jgi:NAD+ diphosphatase